MGEAHPQPRLDPLRRLMDYLGNPQKAYPIVHITGTNGKTSTARYIESLLASHDLRIGRYTSPHLASVTERIVVDGGPISAEGFVEAWQDIAVFVDMVDGELRSAGEPPLTYFEVLTALAYSVFAATPVDVAVIEVGLGGEWDATNVGDATVAVFTPISVDHVEFLGDSVESIATEKAGIIKPECSVVTSRQTAEAAAIIEKVAYDNKCIVSAEGSAFSLLDRRRAVGGQLIDVQGMAARYEEVFLPAHGDYQAHNAALAVAATEALIGRGGTAVPGDVMEEAFGKVRVPGRLEVVRPQPTIVVDAAHNPAGLAATLGGFEEAFEAKYTVALVGILEGKDAEMMLSLLEPAVDTIVVTQSTSPRSITAEALGEMARDIFDDDDRVIVADRLDDAVATAANLAEAHGDGHGVVLATGSVTIAGEVRLLHRLGTE